MIRVIDVDGQNAAPHLRVVAERLKRHPHERDAKLFLQALAPHGAAYTLLDDGITRWRSGKSVIATNDTHYGRIDVVHYFPGFLRLVLSGWLLDRDVRRIKGRRPSNVGFELTVMPHELPMLTEFAVLSACGLHPHCRVRLRQPSDEAELSRQEHGYAWSERAGRLYDALLARCGGSWDRKAKKAAQVLLDFVAQDETA